jgi:hypothetical protein
MRVIKARWTVEVLNRHHLLMRHWDSESEQTGQDDQAREGAGRRVSAHTYVDAR